MSDALPIGIYFEQPNWFKPLFAELDRRGTAYVKIDAVTHSYSPAEHPEEKYSLVFNRMSPSAWNRDHGDQIFYTAGYLEHLELRGVKVINGLAAFRAELSKAGQLSLMEELGVPYPMSRGDPQAGAGGGGYGGDAVSCCGEAEYRREWCGGEAVRSYFTAGSGGCVAGR